MHQSETDRSAEFAVSGIFDITWNPHAFQRLVLPAQKKDLLQALVKQATQSLSKDTPSRTPTFDDFIEEKGQGLVILLHGSPGVGMYISRTGLYKDNAKLFILQARL